MKFLLHVSQISIGIVGWTGGPAIVRRPLEHTRVMVSLKDPTVLDEWPHNEHTRVSENVNDVNKQTIKKFWIKKVLFYLVSD